MLSDVYKDKLAQNVEKMLEIRAAMPKTYKGDSDYMKMKEENKHLKEQIDNYNRLLGNGSNNTQA